MLLTQALPKSNSSEQLTPAKKSASGASKCSASPAGSAKKKPSATPVKLDSTKTPVKTPNPVAASTPKSKTGNKTPGKSDTKGRYWNL